MWIIRTSVPQNQKILGRVAVNLTRDVPCDLVTLTSTPGGVEVQAPAGETIQEDQVITTQAPTADPAVARE